MTDTTGGWPVGADGQSLPPGWSLVPPAVGVSEFAVPDLPQSQIGPREPPLGSSWTAGGLTITGGPGGVVASLEDLDRLKPVLEATRGMLKRTDNEFGRARERSLGGWDQTVFTNCSWQTWSALAQRLDVSRAAVTEAMETAAVFSPNRPGQLAVAVEDLTNSIIQTREIYEQAESAATPSMSIWGQIAMRMSTFPTYGSPVFNAAIAMLVTELRRAADGEIDGGDKLPADVIREQSELIREFLDLSPGPGTPRTREIVRQWLPLLNVLTGKRLCEGITVTAEATPETAPLRSLSQISDRIEAAHKGAENGHHGVIVDRHDSLNGQRSWVVSLPPTDSEPFFASTNPFDWITDASAVAQAPDNDVALGVIEALRQADFKANEPILLAGRSQGGIVAVGVAGALAKSGRAKDIHALSLGSTVGDLDLPPEVKVLAVEHKGDIVPALAGPKNPDGANWITVRRDVQAEGPSGWDALSFAHGSVAYKKTLTVIENEKPARIQPWLEGVVPMLSEGGQVTTTFYNISRICPTPTPTPGPTPTSSTK